MGKRNIANEMSVEELIGNGMSVSKKFDVDPDTKNEFGMLLAQISQRYPSTSALRDAELQASVQHFVNESKKSTRGTYQLAEGTLDKIDLSNDMFIVDGIRIKMSNVYHLEVPGFDPENIDGDEEQDEDEDEEQDDEQEQDEGEDEGWDDEQRNSDDEYRSRVNRDSYSSRGKYYYVEDEDGFTHRLTAAQWNELERIKEAQRRQMERDLENMRRKSNQRCRNYAYDEDGNYIPRDDGYEPDEEYQEKSVDINDDYDDEEKPSDTVKRAPKTIGWLPPEKRKKEPRRKKNTKSDSKVKGSKVA